MSATKRSWGYGLPDQAEAKPTPPPLKQPSRLRHLRGDLAGGATAAMLTIPISMGYGLLAFSPLGTDFIPTAILAGLYAPILGCIIAFLLGANTTMIYSPRSIVTFLVSALVLQIIMQSTIPIVRDANPSELLAIVFLIIFLAGAFQALFGVLHLGTIIKYIPAPVISGFQNAAAVLIFFSQLNPMLGFKTPVPIALIPQNIDSVQPLTLLVGIITCALILRGARITKSIPPTILGLLGGVTLYYLFYAAGFGSHLGPTVGTIPHALPTPHFLAEFMHFFTDEQWLPMLPHILTAAISLAIVASLDAMLCARVIEVDSGHRMRSNSELMRIGVGNMVSASFGGMANGVNLASSFANHRSGAQTPLSLLVHSGTLILAVAVATPLISHLPLVVIAAMLVVVSIQLFDRWTLQIIEKLLRRNYLSAQSMLLDLMVIALVAIVAIAMNIVFAVGLGIAVTVMFFLFRMSKSIVRRSYQCDVVRSRKTREPRQMAILAEHGAKILVLELEGPIFFGTAENLALYLESAGQDNVSYVIIDIKRVNEIDSTGAKMLLQTHDRLLKEGKHFLLSSFTESTHVANLLHDLGITTALTRQRLFSDTDRAIEWAEEHLILSQPSAIESGFGFIFSQLDVFFGMDETDLVVMKTVLERRSYYKNDIIFREGDLSDELYIVEKGGASVRLRLAGSEGETRLATFSHGTVFGELALLDQKARSATVVADSDLVCYVLTRRQYDALTAEYPAIAIKLLANLGRELSGRLRHATRTIYQLSS